VVSTEAVPIDAMVLYFNTSQSDADAAHNRDSFRRKTVVYLLF